MYGPAGECRLELELGISERPLGTVSFGRRGSAAASALSLVVVLPSRAIRGVTLPRLGISIPPVIGHFKDSDGFIRRRTARVLRACLTQLRESPTRGIDCCDHFHGGL